MIELAIQNQKEVYSPGDVIDCEYRVLVDDPRDVQAIETSVLWYTSGKGDEDIGVHFFKRRLKREMSANELEKTHRFSVELPGSPLSYRGSIIQVNWCVRVRVFFKKGRQQTFDVDFQLGDVGEANLNQCLDDDENAT